MKVHNKLSLLRRVVLSRESAIVLLCVILFIFVANFVVKIPQNIAQPELEALQSVKYASSIIDNPINLPYKIVGFFAQTQDQSPHTLRYASLSILALTCIAAYFTFRTWHTTRASTLGALGLATNSLALASGRLGTTAISVMSFFIFTSLLLWQLHSRSNKAVPLLVLIYLATLIYVPGFVWFVLVIGIVYWRKFRYAYRHVKRKAVVIGCVLSTGVLTPLVLGFVRTPELIRDWLLLPDSIIWSSVPRSILRIPSAFIYRMPADPIYSIGRLPILDIASGILFLVGLYAYSKKLRLDRTKVMIGITFVAIVLGALGQTMQAVIMLLPFVYSVITAGIEYMGDEWTGTFPINPIAKSFGVVLVSSVMLFSMYYQTTRFFIVWPQTQQTRDTYSIENTSK